MYQMNGEMHSLRSSLIFARFRLPFEECLTSFRFCSPADSGFFLFFFVGMAFLLLCFTCPFSSLFNDMLLPIHKRDANKQTNKQKQKHFSEVDQVNTWTKNEWKSTQKKTLKDLQKKNKLFENR